MSASTNTASSRAATAARQLGAPMGDAGGRWMLAPEVLGSSKDHGYSNGLVYYFLGRGGVLGTVDADVVTAAFGFFEPSLVRTMWELGLGVEDPRQAAARFGTACADYGRTRLAEFAGAARFVELAERLIDGAPVMGLSLFAGWRAQSRPADAPARAHFLAHVLREWRGSAHVAAAAASGLTPLESILARHGTARAKMFGWGDTFDDTSHLTERREHCEELTDQICAVALEATLSPDEQRELIALALQLQTALG